MENKYSSLLPYVLESLNQKPELCDTHDSLRKEIRKVFSAKNPSALDEDIDEALVMGQNLGILTMTDDLVSLPFNYGPGRLKTNKAKSNKNSVASEGLTEYFGVQPRRTHNVQPEFITLARHRRGGRRRRGSRRRSGSRRRRSRSRRR